MPFYWRGARGAARRILADSDGSWSRRVFDRFMLDGLTRLGDVLARSRCSVTGSQERSGAQERDQGEGQYRRSLAHDVTSGWGFGVRHGKGASARSFPDRVTIWPAPVRAWRNPVLADDINVP